MAFGQSFSGGGQGSGGLLGGANAASLIAEPRTALVLKQPGAPLRGPNEYNSMRALGSAMAAIRGGGRVLLDPSHLGAGAGFDIDADAHWYNWELAGELSVPSSGAFIAVRVAHGIMMPGFRKLSGPVQLRNVSATSSPIGPDVLDGDWFSLERGAQLHETGGAALIDTAGLAGMVLFNMQNLSSFQSAGTPVVLDPATVMLLILDNAVINAGAISGGTLIYLKFGAAARIDSPQGVAAVIASIGEVPARSYRSVKTANFTAQFGSWNPIDVSSAPVTMTLPEGTGVDTGERCEGFVVAGRHPVTVAGAGGQTVNGSGSLNVAAGGPGTLIRALFDGISNWDVELTNLFGKDYQSANNANRITTTGAGFVQHTQLVTPALRGKYRVVAHALVDSANTMRCRLQNVTDAATIPSGPNAEIPAVAASNRIPVSFEGELIFTGAAKTIELQFSDDPPPNDQAGMSSGFIALWRVGD